MITPLDAEMMLDQAAPGLYRCDDIFAEGIDAVRLKRLGLCVGRPMELVSPGDPMVLRIAGGRVGVSRQLARQVQVVAIVPQTNDVARLADELMSAAVPNS